MKVGFGRVDITPRAGVELCGFGPYLCRRSIGIRDKLWARAAAFRDGGRTLVIISCDLIGLPRRMTERVWEEIGREAGLPSEAVMVHCTHTHSGPSTGCYIGWGEADAPYLEILPGRIARAAIAAVANLTEAQLFYAEAPCEGIGYNREYDRQPALEEALRDDWRPAKPELTDTICHVVSARSGGRLLGFLSSFGCHPVVCCQATRYIHGDFVGVATNLLESENPGATGLFLQGALGDVNTCVVHKPEEEAMRAMDVIAARYAAAVRRGLNAGRPLNVSPMACVLKETAFSRRRADAADLRRLLAEKEAVLRATGASDGDREIRMAAVHAAALRRMLSTLEGGGTLEPPTFLQGFRLGELTMLATPFEVFQAIKNDVRSRAGSPLTLVLSATNDVQMYAADRTAIARGGYASDFAQTIGGYMPLADPHGELAEKLLDMYRLLHA